MKTYQNVPVGQSGLFTEDASGNPQPVSPAAPIPASITGTPNVRDADRPLETYANEDVLAVAGTAQLLANGAELTTFAVAVKAVMITTDLACYVARTTAKAGAAAAGGAGDRIKIPAGTVGLVLPWSGQDVAFVNADGTELPKVSVVGLV